MADWAKKFAGRFLVIDGPDGAGKSTQLRLLAEFLREAGLDVTETRDPGGTAIGDNIRHILLDNDHGEMTVDCEVLLYMASRAQLAGQVIRPALAAGQCVLCDRWVSSTLAYQAADGPERLQQIADIYRLSLGGLTPDVTIILDLPSDAGLGRITGKLDRMEAKGVEFHRRVRKLFVEIARNKPDRYLVVDAARPVEAVQADLHEALEQWNPGTANLK